MRMRVRLCALEYRFERQAKLERGKQGEMWAMWLPSPPAGWLLVPSDRASESAACRVEY
jgi:hypothetical protein